MDIAISWDPVRFRGDWAVNAGDLVTDPGGLRSATLLSLFTDRAAPDDWIPPAGTPWERRGWWGDTYETEPIGSWLWLLNRSKKGGPTLLQAGEAYAAGSLAWLKNAGIVQDVTVTADWLLPDVMTLQPTLTPPRSPPVSWTFPWAWKGA